MKRRKLFTKALILAITVNTYSYAQTCLALWNFETQTIDASNGKGILSPIGNISHSFSTGINEGISTEAGTIGTSSGTYGLQTSSYPSASSNNKTAGILISLNTSGFKNIKLVFDCRHSNGAANTQALEYTIDGINWHNAQDFTTSNGADKWYLRKYDFSSTDSVDNNTNFGIRIVSCFDKADGSKYLATNPSSSYATNGTIRFDNIIITGEDILTKEELTKGTKTWNQIGNKIIWAESPKSKIYLLNLEGKIIKEYFPSNEISINEKAGIYLIISDKDKFKVIIK